MLKNALLQKALATIEGQVDDHDAFDRLVSSGTRTIYDKSVFQQLTARLQQSKDPVGDTAHGIFIVMKLLNDKAKDTIPKGVLVQVGMALLIDALDFEEQAGLIKVDNATLDEATKAFMEAAMPAVGLNQGRLNSILQTVKSTAMDPQKMAAFQQVVEKM
jgi:hypothetical protein